jgi:hypothetical protein
MPRRGDGASAVIGRALSLAASLPAFAAIPAAPSRQRGCARQRALVGRDVGTRVSLGKKPDKSSSCDPIWRREWDSNPRYGCPYTRFPSVRLQPLGHPSPHSRSPRLPCPGKLAGNIDAAKTSASAMDRPPILSSRGRSDLQPPGPRPKAQQQEGIVDCLSRPLCCTWQLRCRNQRAL